MSRMFLTSPQLFFRLFDIANFVHLSNSGENINYKDSQNWL